MKRIQEVGNLTVNQQLELLNSFVKKGEILLFQYYIGSDGVTEYMENIDDYFELYCEDIIYYYDPSLKLKIEQEVIELVMEELYFNENENEIAKQKKSRELFKQIKNGQYEKISKQTLEKIKKLVYRKLIICNKNEQFYNFVMERTYGSSQWVIDERGKVQNDQGAIWYRLLNRNEYIEILKNNQLFSCISIKEGVSINEFSLGFVVEETADNYDLLVFRNKCDVV